MTNIRPFVSPIEQASFAREFIERRVWGFNKDINICLAEDASGDHAYMPGLMTCISFLDLLSGLRKGVVDGHDVDDFVTFVLDFTPHDRYGPRTLRILYLAFRHKLAHLGHPLFVLNTAKDRRNRFDPPHMLLTWEISSAAREPPIELIEYPVPQRTKVQPVPREVWYDHRICISVRTLADDAKDAAAAYVNRLETDSILLANFVKCMDDFYQQ
jgi:hypothetical protein